MKLTRFLTALLMCVVIFTCSAALGETADEKVVPVTIVELAEMLYAPDDAALAGKMIRVQAYFGGTFDDGTGEIYGFLILGNPNSCCADSIRSYWGGMLERGAATFWEEFDPAVRGAEQYDMYGDKFGKSLCHAWSASPIYLIARYFVGLRQDGAEDGGFILEPQLEYFGALDCTLPIGEGNGYVRILWDGKNLRALTNCRNGFLRLGERKLPLKPETVFELEFSR